MNQFEKEHTVNYFIDDKRIVAVYLHGSYVKGSMRKDSDIDIALLLEPNIKLNKLELLEISSDLELKLNRTVDIGLLSSENLVYSKEVIKNGICILNNDDKFKMIAETNILTLFAAFNFERREILNEYTK